MQYTDYYESPLGKILLAAEADGLTGLWFVGDRHYAENLAEERAEKETKILRRAKEWLDVYFAGKEPNFTPPLKMSGSPFQMAVWKILTEIPYGTTTTYGEIAKKIAQQRGVRQMSAQATGGAVGHNAISVIVPCHRVIGSGGNLTGYGGGVDKKWKLLRLEGVDMTGLFVPKKGTAL